MLTKKLYILLKVPLFARTAALSVSKKSFLPAEAIFRTFTKF